MSETATVPSPDERLRGSTQANLRARNERAVLTLIRSEGVMAKAEIARRTGLSAQTASVIMRSLEGEELVLRDAPQRGRVGQPSVPMRLNPDGAFSLGLKIGRRSADMILMDFVGRTRGRVRETYSYPTPASIGAFTSRAFASLLSSLDPQLRSRVSGVGVAIPFEIWDWAAEIAAPPGAMDEWRRTDIGDFVSDLTGLPVHAANDGTAACAAEQVFGTSGRSDFVYFFIGTFVGGGIVTDGNLLGGRRGNAGALGSMPVPLEGGGTGQLINAASIHLLEKAMAENGLDPRTLWAEEGVWPAELGPLLDRWIETSASGLAHAVTAASAVYDFECALIDGSLPVSVRDRLVSETARRLANHRLPGLIPVEIQAGTIGGPAREMGAASLPFFDRFLLDQRLMI
ncbi:ROK family transcriptional regulator [Aureimonas psammosilenae]|uniref:ROK family transcriptional regulator n=1 Tax=Aureimonas psammosilenae TaxID=2495496 RepID=UPI001260D2A4|nr:ROK family transcriptional regulator [Aureimonas psammosilenae]